MTITLFVSILTLGSVINSLLTEAVKKFYENAHKEYSANVVALVDALVIGGLGTAAVYQLLGIKWDLNNLICLCIMIVAVWIASMVGYDKVIQMIQQIDFKRGETKDADTGRD